MYMALGKGFFKLLFTDFISIYPQITHYQLKNARLHTILIAFSEQLETGKNEISTTKSKKNLVKPALPLKVKVLTVLQSHQDCCDVCL